MSQSGFLCASKKSSLSRIGVSFVAPYIGNQRRRGHIGTFCGDSSDEIMAYRSFSSDALEASSSLVEVLSSLLSVLSKSSSRPRTLFVNPINSDSALTYTTRNNTLYSDDHCCSHTDTSGYTQERPGSVANTALCALCLQ